jgi:ribosome biogenesis GTPase A
VGTQPSRQPVFPPEIAPYIDVGAYLLDARAPAATLYLEQLLEGKELLLLTRAGLAESRVTSRWRHYLLEAGYPCVIVDSVTGVGFDEVLDHLARLLRRKQELARKRGIRQPVLRMAALGVPNVGKSTFLNRLLGRRRLKTGDRPGITRGHQWVRLFEDVEVLDTPGVLRDPVMLRRRKPCWMLLNLLPYDAALREATVELLRQKLSPRGWRKLRSLYQVPEEHFEAGDWLALLESIARPPGGKALSDDTVDRTARRLLLDFQRGRLGRISLEKPDEDHVTSPVFLARLRGREREQQKR